MDALGILKHRGLGGLDAVTCLLTLEKKVADEGGLEHAITRYGGCSHQELIARFGMDAARAMSILIAQHETP